MKIQVTMTVEIADSNPYFNGDAAYPHLDVAQYIENEIDDGEVGIKVIECGSREIHD